MERFWFIHDWIISGVTKYVYLNTNCTSHNIILKKINRFEVMCK